MKFNKKCKICGKGFETNYQNKIYCGNIFCYRQGQKNNYAEKKAKSRKTLFCRFCGEEIKNPKNYNQKYCKPRCQVLNQNKKKRKEKRKKILINKEKENEIIDISKINDLEHYNWYKREIKKQFPGVISPYGNLFDY
jgi:predicted nucleic acid-binding Zn ribbon protein